ncbi:glycine--tRNA ligase subunit beta [Rhodovarius crocodyli]|uniref:Glycine--tRNA ligase beta subunit n=1 Tax=Rhodovarius crocodyli TaxID=1979269 RepID=A0A437MNK5_9PROT|nr:glycine--tRNA ligase subunit beta [Rhodovarius crocodyli]RVT99216.1 glycine--tRNA ligase subunit beta [Rhodovarius crocodyli]
MPELLLELLTEEIPARMQARAAEDLCRLVGAALAPIAQGAPRGFHGPRRIGLVMQVAASAETAPKEERGPRTSAPEAALTGFLRKHGATKEDLTQQGDFWVLVKPGSSTEAAALIAGALPGVLWSFPWPKSMRWGISGFTWVRPLQRILCLLDGQVVPFALAREDDAAHGIASGDETEGHRVHGPGAFRVSGYADFVSKLRDRFVVVEPEERLAAIREGIAALASAEGLDVVPDEGLLNEVAGLVEWPVPLLGRIDDDFMDLPAEVMRTSMRVNQRYFALRKADGSAAPRFALVANIAAADGGAALVAGNERVLRARLSDARFFWDHDLKAPLESLLPKLDGAVFHAKLGTQGDRVRRLEELSRSLAPFVGADPDLAARAAKLAKADLASGMVGEFPELQGIMGGYYAARGGETPEVAEAVSQHYRPLGPTDAVPTGPVAIAVALADKLDQLAGFFAVGEKPTGSGDPFALRRAALGVIRIIRENNLRLRLWSNVLFAAGGVQRSIRKISDVDLDLNAIASDVTAFILERLRVQLRAEGGRHDLVAASIGTDDDILRILARASALQSLVETETGAALLAAARRAQNILRIENKKDGPHDGPVNSALLADEAEKALFSALETAEPAARAALEAENFAVAVETLAALRVPLDAFFESVMVNAPDPDLRANRLRLLHRLATSMADVAELSQIEA